MAVIQLRSEVNALGPMVPGDIGVVAVSREVRPDIVEHGIVLQVGRDLVEIYPADPDRLVQLSKRLAVVAMDVHRKQAQR